MEKNLYETKKEISNQRGRIYLASLFFMFGGFYFVNVFIMHISVSIILINLFLSILSFAIGTLFYNRILIKENKYLEVRKYDEEAIVYLHRLSDKYIKRTFNSLAVIFVVIFGLFINNVSMVLGGRIRYREIWMSFASIFVVLEIPVFLHIKEALCSRLIQARIDMPDHATVIKHLKIYWLGSAIYWLSNYTFIIIFQRKVRSLIVVYIILTVIYFTLAIIYNNTLRKQITYENLVINIPRILLYACMFIIIILGLYMQKDTWFTLDYITKTPKVVHTEDKITYEDKTGVYTITAKEDDFKILQLTDIHLGGSLYSYKEDMMALKAVYEEIEYTRPDLVIVTGDLTFPVGVMSMSFNNTAPVSQFAQFMRNMGIPWAFTYGNHDTENIATGSKSDLNSLYKSLSFYTSETLLYPYSQPPITGRNNQLIELRNADGSLNQALFLIDSNAYTGDGLNEYDYIHDDQVLWYKSQIERLNDMEGHNVSSLVFFHIPLQEYKTAYELYEAGSSEVKYYFGENNEKVKGKVCCSNYPSDLFDTMVELGSTKATFCGHDHYNNTCIEYKGIKLTYGMSIDYLAMPGIKYDVDQRGGTLITIHKDSSFDIEQVPLSLIEKNKDRK